MTKVTTTTHRRPKGQKSGCRCCYLSSGLSPSAQEFHLVHRPLDAVGSRTLTAGSELHRSRSTCFQYATADVSPPHATSEERVNPVRCNSISGSVSAPHPCWGLTRAGASPALGASLVPGVSHPQ